MTRKEALESLLAKVVAGNAHLRSHYTTAFKDLNSVAWSAYNGSLDAAMTLHNAVLPGFKWGRSSASDISCFYVWSVRGTEYSRLNDSGSRAWLVCILKALIAQEAE